MDVIKDTEQGDGRDEQGKACEERHQASMPSLGGRSPSISTGSPTWKLSYLRNFYRGFSTWA